MGELDFLLWLQSLSSPWLDTMMGAITQMGSEYFYLAALCFLYWCVDVRGTLRLFILFLVSVYLVGAIKEITAQLRPFQARPDVIQARYTSTAEDYAFPSGHTTHGVVFWGYLALVVRRRWLYILAPIVILLIAFSRLYLGLHWPRDILGGLVTGLTILGVGYVLFRLLASTPIQARFPATLVLALLPLAFYILFPTPSGAQSMGVLFGAVLGHLIERQYVRFPVRRPWWQQALKMAIGLSGALLLMIGLRGILAPLDIPIDSVRFDPEATLPLLGYRPAFWIGESPRLLRYALVGLWATLAAPGLFRLLLGAEEVGAD